MPLEIEKLSRRSGGRWVLRDVEFTASEGLVFGICGPTGSGKTILLNTIAGREKTTGARLSLDDRDITRVRAKDRDIQTLAAAEAPGIFGIFGLSKKTSSGERRLEAFE